MKPFISQAKHAKKEARPDGLQSGLTSRHETPIQEVNDMPFEHDIGQNAPKDNPEQNENWQSLGGLVKRIVEDVAKKREAGK